MSNEAPERIWFAVENTIDLVNSVAVVPFHAPPQRNAIEYRRVDPPAAPTETLAQQDHERVKVLLEGIHCPKHGMEWEACCLSEVILEVHWKIKDLLATVRAEAREAERRR
jgi:hypothetical protein